MRVWDLERGREARSLGGRGPSLSCVTFSPDGRLLAAAGLDHTIVVWEVASGRTRTTLGGHTQAVSGLAFIPDGRRLASGGWDRTVRVWELASGQEVLGLAGHVHPVLDVAFRSDGPCLSSIGADPGLGGSDRELTVISWEAMTGGASPSFHPTAAQGRGHGIGQFIDDVRDGIR